MDNDELNKIIEELKKTLIRNGVKDISSYDNFFESSKNQMKEKIRNNENDKTI